MFDRSRRGENALLVQPHAPGRSDPAILEEFEELARSAGATIVATVNARVERANPALLIGTGKVEELRELCAAHGADLVLVNHTLTPVQERNLEKLLGVRVVDRTGLILDIFAQRAHSFEGKLQVELAQLRHVATRLVRGWTHLERQRGGAIGLRGPGETQLEMDRRLLGDRVKILTRRLQQVEKQRGQSRRARLRSEIPRIALVGYTNAGKSTLFNALTGAEAYAADQLFATLDPTVRRMQLSSGGASGTHAAAADNVVLSDTVGFVRDLPHDLVAAFRSTLSETRDADLLLHVIDAADPAREQRIAQVDAVLAEIGAEAIPQVLVYNKIDLLEGAQPRRDAQPGAAPPRVWVSAATGAGLDLLKQELAERVGPARIHRTVRLPQRAGRLRAQLFAAGAVVSERHDDDGWHIELDLPQTLAEQLCAGTDPDADTLRGQLLAGS